MTERWLPVVGFEGYYEVSDEGRVRSLSRLIQRSTGAVENHKGKVIKQSPSGKGYLKVPLNVGGKRTQVGVHRLVAKAFLPPPAIDEVEVNHKDLVKTNNRVGNLEWMTRKGNALHALQGGRYAIQHVGGRTLAINNPARAKKLTADQVLEIRALRGSLSQCRIGKRFGITQSTVSKIHLGVNWAAAPKISATLVEQAA